MSGPQFIRARLSELQNMLQKIMIIAIYMDLYIDPAKKTSCMHDCICSYCKLLALTTIVNIVKSLLQETQGFS